MKRAFYPSYDINLGTSINSNIELKIHSIGCWIPLWLLCLVTLVITLITLSTYHEFDAIYFLQSNFFAKMVFGYAISFILLYHAIKIMVVERPKSLLATYTNRLFAFIKQPLYWLVPSLNFASLFIFIACYGIGKKLIPVIHPFTFDQTFIALDRYLHFGVDPWRITHQIFASDFATYSLNFAYHSWFFLLFGSFAWAVLARKHQELRAQYMLAAMALWIIGGNLLATIFSSVGPCYVKALTGSDYYQPLMSLLASTDDRLTTTGWGMGLPALLVQESLWKDYIQGGQMLGGGISAFPSLHVAITVAMACLATRLNKYLGILTWLFAIYIQIGSVHLGWHYAVDGYASWLLTWVVWSTSGWLVRRSSKWTFGTGRTLVTSPS